jgi:hypothetical protein
MVLALWLAFDHAAVMSKRRAGPGGSKAVTPSSCGPSRDSQGTIE